MLKIIEHALGRYPGSIARKQVDGRVGKAEKHSEKNDDDAAIKRHPTDAATTLKENSQETTNIYY